MSVIARCERGCDPPREATCLIRAGLEWHPCCDECATWWAEHRKSDLATPRGTVEDAHALASYVRFKLGGAAAPVNVAEVLDRYPPRKPVIRPAKRGGQ